MVVTVDLLPRTPLTVSVEFIEPDSDIAPTLTVQPLARAGDVAIVDEPCATG